MSCRRSRSPIRNPVHPAGPSLALLAIALFAASGCPPPTTTSTLASDPDTATAATAAPASPGPLPPLQSSPFIDLPVAAHRPAVVSVPIGATTPRPVIVAAHGAGDRPDWQCRFWRDIVGDRAFVVCPRGFPFDPRAPADETGYFYTTHHQLGREVSEALRAFAARFGAHADLTNPVYAGFSQGAIMGALLLPVHPARFARAVLIEGGVGGYQEWNLLVARSFKEQGGESVLFACGGPTCAGHAQVSADYLQKQGVLARVAHAPGAGHTYGGGVAEQVAQAFPWLVERDPRFQ